MTPDQALTPIKARLEAATDGPFIVARYDHGGGRMFVEAEGSRRELIADTFKIGDREFIANAPTDITRLLAAVEAVEAVAADLQRRGVRIEEQGCNGSIYATRSEGRGYGYREAADLVRAALSEALGGGE